MRGVVRIAWRNTRRQGRRAVLLGGAIAFGVMIITLLNAFTSGAVGNIKDNFSYAVGGHIFVTGTELTDRHREVGRIGDDFILRAAVEETDPRIVSVHRRSAAFATLIFGSKVSSQRIEGVDFAEETELSRGLQVREGSVEDLSDPRALILPASTAERLGVMPGETVLVRLSTVTGQQNVGELRVIAIIEEVIGFGASSAYASLVYLNELIGLDATEYQMFNVFLHDMNHIDEIADELYGALTVAGAPVERPLAEAASHTDFEEEGMAVLGQMFGQMPIKIAEEPWDGTKFSLTTLNELMEPIVSAMSVLDAIARGIFVIVLVITGVGILNTFRMIMIERTREIGALRAFGMQKGTVRSIFLWEAGIIALGGAVVGLVLAGIVALIISSFTLTGADAASGLQGLEFFLDGGRITFAVTPADLVTNVVVLLVISLAAALLPANAAANLQPVQALGSHY